MVIAIHHEFRLRSYVVDALSHVCDVVTIYCYGVLAFVLIAIQEKNFARNELLVELTT